MSKSTISTFELFARLTEDEVRFARSLKGKIGFRRIAKMLGVSPGAIQPILAGRTWKHVR